MASRAILQKKKYLLGSIKRSNYLVQGFLCPQQGKLIESVHSREKGDSQSLTKHVAKYGSTKKDFGYNFFCVSTLHREAGIRGGFSSLGYRCATEHVRYLSTAAAGQPQLGGRDDKKEEPATKQKKEPSPEECDQAVEGLSSVKAKAKAKKLQESQRGANFILKKTWAILLGIGPALRAIASMSREDWGKKLRHWKDEFKSTLQHYWLGTKLLWVDVRISLRLLLKLGNGKAFSRRERQQLTRTTTDIFSFKSKHMKQRKSDKKERKRKKR